MYREQHDRVSIGLDHHHAQRKAHTRDQAITIKQPQQQQQQQPHKQQQHQALHHIHIRALHRASRRLVLFHYAAHLHSFEPSRRLGCTILIARRRLSLSCPPIAHTSSGMRAATRRATAAATSRRLPHEHVLPGSQFHFGELEPDGRAVRRLLRVRVRQSRQPLRGGDRPLQHRLREHAQRGERGARRSRHLSSCGKRPTRRRARQHVQDILSLVLEHQRHRSERRRSIHASDEERDRPVVACANLRSPG